MPFLDVHHDPLIVGQSIAIAIFASYVAIDLVGRARSVGQELARAWWIAGSIALGTGIWAMHFVGMLSLALPIALGYAPMLTTLSWMEAVGTSMLVLRLAARDDPGRMRLVRGAITMGAGICGMHYTGMAALELSPGIAWAPWLVAASLTVSVAGSGAALLILRRMARDSSGRGAAERLLAALIMGLTISAMHYTGMAAAAFPAGSVCISAGQLAGSNLGPIVAACAVALLAITLVGSIIDARQQSRTALQAAALQRALDTSEAATRDLAFERERLSNFIQGTDVGTWEWSLSNDALEVDARGACIIGYTLDELRPLTLARWRAMTHPDDVTRSARLLGQHLEGALERYDCESRVRHKDGHWVWLLARGKIIRRDARGAALSMAGTHMDITERKGFEAELRRRVEKEDMYKQVFDAVSESILVRGPNSSILWANRAFLAFFGMTNEQLQGQLDVPFAPSEATAQYLLDDARVLSSGQALDIPDELVTRFDGTTRRWHTVKSPLLGSRQEVVATVGVSRDITDRREAEAQASRAGELMRGAIDAVGEAFVLYDPEERLVFCNDKYRELFGDAAPRIVKGISFEEVLRIGAPKAMHGLPADAESDWLDERLAAFRIGDKPTMERLSDGRILRSIVRKMADGHTVGFRIDITELMRATDVAQAASVSKSQFLANMSHEIRTPMNAILGMLSLLRRTALDAPQDDYAAKAERAARSLLGLLNDILDFSKVEAGKMTVDLQPFGIERLLQDLIVILGANVGAKPVALRLDIDSALPPLLVGDATRLLQVLINLGGNAVKFTDHGEVVLSIAVVERQGQGVTLEFAVRDSGIGIAPENQARIFSEFTQAESSTTRRFGGTGLGLTISARLVALMGGELQLTSVLGQGSRFFFRLTLDVASAENLLSPSAPEVSVHDSTRSPRLSGLRVLLAEDNANNQQVARELLELEGVLVSIANDGQQALDALRADGTQFDLVLMDVQMPILDGLAATRRIRDELGLTALPIVAMTANAMASDRQACIDAGMDDHVGKPFDLDALVRTLHLHAGHAIKPASEATRARHAPESAAASAPQTICITEKLVSALPSGPEQAAHVHRAAQAAAVDFDTALGRLGGNRAIYAGMLARFLRELVGMDRSLQEYHSRHRASDASQLMHTLRGLAATLGLRGLAAQAAQAEKLLCSAPETDALDSTISGIRAAMSDSAPSLSFLLHALESELAAFAPAFAEKPFDAAAFDVALLALVTQLRQADMGATRSMQEVRIRFGAALGERLRPLEEAIDGLDFRRALALCDTLAS